MARFLSIFLIVFVKAVFVSAEIPSCFVIFGDDISDDGNLFNLSNGTFPDSKTYFKGRISDGPIWTDFIVEYLFHNNVSAIDNYAFIRGSAIDQFSLAGDTVNLWDQIDMYEDDGIRPECLHVFFFGQNDALYFILEKLYNPQANLPTLQQQFSLAPYNITETVMDAVRELYTAHNVKNFLIIPPFNLAMIPYLQVINAMVGQNSVYDMMNWYKDQLTALFLENAKYFNTLHQLNIRCFARTAAVFDWMYVSPSLNFSQATQPCLEATSNITSRICTNPSEHMFFDSFCPTSKAHKQFALSIIDFLNGECTICKPSETLCTFCRNGIEK